MRKTIVEKITTRRSGIVMAVLVAVVAAAAILGMVFSTPVMAENDFTKEACSSSISEDQKEALGCNDGGKQVPNVAVNLIKVVIGIVGLVTVVMIIVAGQKYITAQGDPGQLQQAKNMIMYSIIGLVVAILAFAIVVFVENVVLNAENGTQTSSAGSYSEVARSK